MKIPQSIGSWICMIIGTATLALFLGEIDHGISTGVFTYTSTKYGLSFVGFPALVIQICWAVVSSVLVFIGYRGIKNRTRDGA